MLDFVLIFICVLCHYHGSNRYWGSILFLGVICTICSLIYVFSCIKYLPQLGESPYIDFSMGSMSDFMAVSPILLWLYLGIEAIPLIAEETVEPKQSIPKGMTSGMIFLVLITLIVFDILL